MKFTKKKTKTIIDNDDNEKDGEDVPTKEEIKSLRESGSSNNSEEVKALREELNMFKKGLAEQISKAKELQKSREKKSPKENNIDKDVGVDKKDTAPSPEKPPVVCLPDPVPKPKKILTSRFRGGYKN